MKKTLFPLFLTLWLCVLMSSCSDFFVNEEEYATVSFHMKASSAKALASREALPEVLMNTKLSVTLFVNDTAQTKTADLTKNGVTITFDQIEVGSTVSADVRVIKNGEIIAAGSSSESIVVVKGENTLSVKITYAANGNILLGDKITIQLDAENSSETIVAGANNNKWTFKLIDENGNNILDDVDWDAMDESLPNPVAYNAGLLNISVLINKGPAQIVGSDNQSEYFYKTNNTENLIRPLSAGNYEMTVTIMPGSLTYMNTAGQILSFPQFEPASASFEFTVVE